MVLNKERMVFPKRRAYFRVSSNDTNKYFQSHQKFRGICWRIRNTGRIKGEVQLNFPVKGEKAGIYVRPLLFSLYFPTEFFLYFLTVCYYFPFISCLASHENLGFNILKRLRYTWSI